MGMTVLTSGYLLVLSEAASAHAVVFPSEAPPGAYQKYVLRVPNERGVPTNQISIVFPGVLRVISFEEVTGWQLETTSTDGGATFTAATWTGSVAVGRFVEFAFIGVNPQEATTLKWDVIQTYADGEAVSWSGPPDSSTPASLTRVRAPEGDLDKAGSPGSGIVLGGLALVLALVALGLALRPDRPR
jgi:uncharacterized protein YcnI